jgi:hypothetical protein
MQGGIQRAGKRTAARPQQEGDDVGDLGRLEQPLDGMRREDHILEDAVLRKPVRFRLVGDLRFDERRAHERGADRGRSDPDLRAFQSQRLHQPEQPVLGSHVRSLVRRGDETVNRADGDEAAAPGRREGLPGVLRQ